MPSLLLFGLALALALVVGGVLYERTNPRRAIRPADTSALPPDVIEYLATLDSNLALPPEIRAEIRAELADHLADSIDAIEAEGLDRDRAAREALARLGRPEDLAIQLRNAHQTTRRLLAGAAGGVFQAGAGALFGYVLALAIAVILSIVTGTALKPLLNLLSEKLPEVSRAAGAGSGIWTAIFLVPAFVAGRRSVRAFGSGSRRTARQIGRWWALGGFALLGWLVLFVISVDQSWVTVTLESLIPVAFAVGAIYRPDRALPLANRRVPAWLVLASVIALPVAMFAGMSFGTGGSASSWSDNGQLGPALDRIAPRWTGDIGLEDRWGATYGPVIDETWQIRDPGVLASMRDVRFELWRAVSMAGAPDWAQAYVPAAGYTTPYATQPANVSAGTFTARFDVGHCRTSHWLLLLTGVGPDGVRYRIDWRSENVTTFSGTIWDWLTAGS